MFGSDAAVSRNRGWPFCEKPSCQVALAGLGLDWWFGNNEQLLLGIPGTPHLGSSFFLSFVSGVPIYFHLLGIPHGTEAKPRKGLLRSNSS